MRIFDTSWKKAAALLLAALWLLPAAGCRLRLKNPGAEAASPRPSTHVTQTLMPTQTDETAVTPSQSAAPTPPQPAVTTEPTEWPVERHWWVFTPMGYGLSRGAGVFYNSLWNDYLVYPQGAVVIGRIKGYDTGKVYTKDPEERVIWVPYTDAFPYRACYSLSDFALPEPVIGDNDLCVSDFEYAGGTISDSAKAEALSCIERLQTEGTHPLDESKIVFSAYLSIAFRECAGLGYLLPYRLVFTQDGVVYFAKYWDYGIVNCFALDPDSVLLKEFEDILARSDAANEEFVFMQMMLNSSGEVVTDPHHLSASR